MRRFLVIVEEGDNNLSAYSPDLPGCIATGATYDETLQNMYEAIEFHLEAMLEDGEPIPQGFSLAAYLTLPEPAAPMTPLPV
ncbi:MAG: type II toxin-antitoxin system HicB family antitoxin [Caldilineae bacterium]|nr:type II toxin-antitoxin system HicB family antitoxin [Anaerolineae bacterium]MCB0205635.1 type II toxin-antitoxin system HicB family antitoxin [Anaerolineae bacterium]MCB9153962.1 type II toxin-antitoxin system HicB family antitoxin [Caldilineae bacterium]